MTTANIATRAREWDLGLHGLPTAFRAIGVDVFGPKEIIVLTDRDCRWDQMNPRLQLALLFGVFVFLSSSCGASISARAMAADEAAPLTDSEVTALTKRLLDGDADAILRLAAHGPTIVPRVRPHADDSAPEFRSLIEKIVRAELRRSLVEEGSVRYGGQFSYLSPLGAEGAKVLLSLFANEDESIDTRGRAATALGDTGGKAQIPELEALADDYLSEAWVEREAIFLLARFGERKRVERRLKEFRKIAEQSADSQATIPAILTAHGELAEVHYRIGEFEAAIRHYVQKQALLLEMQDRVRPELRGAIQAEIDLLQYNLACSLALAGRILEAFRALDRSMESREVTLEMVRTDGDLRAVRSDPGFSVWIAGWEGRHAQEKAGEEAESPDSGQSPEESEPKRRPATP